MARPDRLAPAVRRDTTANLCSRCIHYHVTWDPRLPYGCRAMGFKSRQLPCRVVYESSGAVCRAFFSKPSGRR